MSHLIKVTNKNNFTISEYFEGIPYNFAPDEPVNVPLDAMKHIFGVDFPGDEATLKSAEFREQVFRGCIKRFGWNAYKAEDIAQNKKSCNNLVFTPIVTRMVEMVAENEEVAAPREQKAVKAAGKFKPRADEVKTDEEEVA